MKKLVIANSGITDRGKTQALKKVIEDLLSNGAKEVERKSYPIDEDVTAILDYKGIRIGIETQGDPGSRLFSSLKDFIKKECEIIVCACRTSGNTYKEVMNLKKQHSYEIIWYSNPYVESIKKGEFPDKVKAVYAKSVREIIEKRISGEI
jgi:hypothetical protein